MCVNRKGIIKHSFLTKTVSLVFIIVAISLIISLIIQRVRSIIRSYFRLKFAWSINSQQGDVK